MYVTAVLLPVFVQVALTFAVLIRLGMKRLSAIRGGAVVRERVIIDETGWPLDVRQASNCFRNQFEVPVLFYVLAILALITRQAGDVFVVLAWLFVLSRVVHAVVHVTSNDVRWRFGAFAFGVLVLLAMWVLFALAILLAPALP
ncbi:MAPEG family protein [Starkeya koreensis]|uniref:MAPEG family protein n=1 Tax=Ancylobacter koreensis TaxID=266121 RepID=A0ABT0DRY1_9HYPH|nr:MAPEG family protein [Ancylobacter koreensis]MCK0209882.1 MAPEG family protein [Ancylobacter koreensis]